MKKMSMFKILVVDLFIVQGVKNCFNILTLTLAKKLYKYLQKNESEDIGRKVDPANLTEQDIEQYDRLIPKALQWFMENLLTVIVIVFFLKGYF